MAKKNKSKTDISRPKEILRIEYPDLHKGFLLIGFSVTFLIQIIIYLISLAPTVTFEDSGELIAAAYTLGVPHQPGYPLFTILGKLFTFLPFGSIAFRVNLMSAFFSALAISVLFLTIIYIIDEIAAVAGKNNKGTASGYDKYVIAMLAALFAGVTPSYYSQALITEVYGINNFFTALTLFIILRWYRAHNSSIQGNASAEQGKNTNFLVYGLLCGLTLTNHHTSLVFLPLGFLFIAIIDYRFLMNMKRLVNWAGCFIAGLIPYVYLPIASSAKPAIDWGNPETWTNFWRVVTRHQYGLDLSQTRSFQKLTSQIGLHYQLFLEEFGWILLIAGLAGVIILWLRRKPVFMFTLFFAFLTGPLVAYVTNVDITVRDPFAVAEQRALVSVMYLPFYLLWGCMIGAGLYAVTIWISGKINRKFITIPVITLSALYLVLFGHKNYLNENMSDYYYADQFFNNLEKLAPSNSIIIANWDPFAFPALYYQFVEKRFPDMIFIDVELLRRSWYIEMLRNNYPDYMRLSAKETDEFLSAVKPFEEGEKFDPNFIQSKYMAMINSFIDYHYESRPIYLTIYYPIRPLENGVAPGYGRESCFIAQRLVLPGAKIQDVDYRQFDFPDMFSTAGSGDRMSDMLKNYYAILFAEKAIATGIQSPRKAFEYFDRSLELAESQVIRKNIIQRQQTLKQMTLPK